MQLHSVLCIFFIKFKIYSIYHSQARRFFFLSFVTLNCYAMQTFIKIQMDIFGLQNIFQTCPKIAIKIYDSYGMKKQFVIAKSISVMLINLVHYHSIFRHLLIWLIARSFCWENCYKKSSLASLEYRNSR